MSKTLKRIFVYGLVGHGKTRWLCNYERDFIYYTSKMAYESNLRDDITCRAKERAEHIGGDESACSIREEVFEQIGKLPE